MITGTIPAVSEPKPNYYIVGLIYFIFLLIALLSSVLGAIIPDLIKSFTLSLTAASLIHVCFYGAYGPFAIPSGMLVESIYDKPVLLLASVLCIIGILLFALIPVYGMILPSFFMVGTAMTMLQGSVNPLLRVAGGAENYAFLVLVVFGPGMHRW